MWTTNRDMVRGLTRFSWAGGWVAFGCAAAAVVLGVVTILTTSPPWIGIVIAGVASGLMIQSLARLQRVKELRVTIRAQDQDAAHAPDA